LRGGGSGAAERMRAYANATNLALNKKATYANATNLALIKKNH
jgi:hypothetical protein